jgi:hypothetical protein
MNALFIIRKDDEAGLEYLRNLATKIVDESLGDVEVTETVDAGVDYYEYRINVSNQNLLLL